ncbi:hypothetical protein GWI24_20730 [Streptomyces sp. MK37H]|nr:hypothetical protein [Streptomyces sp. MK37H]
MDGLPAVEEPLPAWIFPPPDGFTADDLDRIPELPRHTELIDGSLVIAGPQRAFHSLVVTLLNTALRRWARSTTCDRGRVLSARQLVGVVRCEGARRARAAVDFARGFDPEVGVDGRVAGVRRGVFADLAAVGVAPGVVGGGAVAVAAGVDDGGEPRRGAELGEHALGEGDLVGGAAEVGDIAVDAVAAGQHPGRAEPRRLDGGAVPGRVPGVEVHPGVGVRAVDGGGGAAQ